ncbi:MAG: ImmA/IrrE family metallo-endopeptidase [Spirulina sp.]
MKSNLTKNKDIGNRLKSTRTSRKLSIDDVSQKLEMPSETITMIENGEIEGHYPEIYAMTCLYVKSIHEIFEGFFNYKKSPVYLLRNKTDENREEIEQYIIDFIEFYRQANGQNKNIVGLSKTKVPHSMRKISTAVLQTRAQKLIQTHNLYKFPINVYQIASNLGISIVFKPLPNHLYNLRGFCYQEENFALIAINHSHPIELQRFTMAHELHHLLYDINCSPLFCGADNQKEAIEENAERFAAELLMPSSYMQKLVSHPPNINYLTIHLIAEHFKVSYQAASIRLQKFGLIDDSSEVCKSSYRKRDMEKTRILLKNKTKYLKAIFGLETGIQELQVENHFKTHDKCGMPIFNDSDTVCWNCGLELQKSTDQKQAWINNPYRQNFANLSKNKISSMNKKKDYTQLSLNLKID